MEVTITTGSNKWTEFEIKQWKQADTEHYGQAKNWDNQKFHLEIMREQKPVCSLRMDVRGGLAFIDSIIVAPEYRRQGIGRKLMKEAEKVAVENGAHKIYLQAGKDWEAVKFYRDLGYEITSQLPDHYFRVDFVEMTKYFKK